MNKLVSRLFAPETLFSLHLEEANRQYRKTNAYRAIEHLQRCLEISPDNWRGWYEMSIVYSQLVGDIEESLRLLRYARRLRERRYAPGGTKPPHCFFDGMWVMQIGHIANMEHLVKREILQGRDPKRIVLHYPQIQKPANAALLEKMAAYITVVRDEAQLPFPRESMLSVLEEYYLCESLDGLTKHWWHASPEIFRAWEMSGRAPLLSLDDEEKARGRAVLKKMGLPEDAWFVSLHVREGGFKKTQGYGTVESLLNAGIDTYDAAIRAIVARGGWVVRVGDPKMQPLRPLPGVIDYARSAEKNEWMDVFLLAACRFFVGTSSGPAYVPPLFGVPCVLTNWFPSGQRPFNERDLYILKRFLVGFPQRELRFAEMMAPPIGYAPQFEHAKRLGLTPVPNTPQELKEVVEEMLDRIDGTLTYSEEDEALNAAYDAVAETNLCIGNARPGRDFLRRHRHLLMGPKSDVS